MIGGIIYKIGLYTVKNTAKEILKDNHYLKKLKCYKPGNIPIYYIIETGTNVILFLI